MRTALPYLESPILNTENQTILFINMNTPKAGKLALERFRLSLALVSVAVNILNETVDLFQRLLILRLPVQIGLPRFILPQFLHQSASMSSCGFSVLRPASTSAIAARRRAIFSSL